MFAAETIILGRELKGPGVLKCAFYGLLAYHDMSRTDSGRELLGQRDFLRLVTARNSLSGDWIEVAAICSLFDCTSSNDSTSAKHHCARQTGTTARKVAWNKLVHESGIFKDYRYDPIGGLTVLVSLDWRGEGLCDGCLRRMKKELEEERIALWAQLDALLKLKDVEVCLILSDRVSRFDFFAK